LAIHDTWLMHCDLKPQNIFLNNPDNTNDANNPEENYPSNPTTPNTPNDLNSLKSTSCLQVKVGDLGK